MWNGLAEVPPIPDAIKEKVRAMPEAEVSAHFGAEASDNHRRNVRALEVFLATGKHLKVWQAEQAAPMFNIDDFLILVMNVSRETLYKTIDDRFLTMIENGAIEEVKKLDSLGLNPDLPIMKAVGVPELISYLKGERTLEDAISLAQQKSRNYAKRQLTWLRQQLPDGNNKIEVQNMEYADILQLVKKELVL